MIPAANDELPEFDMTTFFRDFWRRKPLFVRGGAKALLGRHWGGADFDAARRVAKSRHAPISEREGAVTFIENVSAHDADLASRAGELRSVFGSPQAWFDAIRTYDGSGKLNGIGPHFDHSDNFVLQQEGAKLWHLAAPEHVDPQVRTRRMLSDPNVGSHPLPAQDKVEFVIEAGDLLYIPLMWLHEGTSTVASLSVSLVCPAVSLYSAVVPFLTHTLKARGLGGEAIVALHAHLSPHERDAAIEQIRRSTRELLQAGASDELIDAVLAAQERRLRRMATA